MFSAAISTFLMYYFWCSADSLFGQFWAIFMNYYTVPFTGTYLFPRLVMFIMYGEETDSVNKKDRESDVAKALKGSAALVLSLPFIGIMFWFMVTSNKLEWSYSSNSYYYPKMAIQTVTIIIVFDALLYVYHYGEHNWKRLRLISGHKTHHVVRNPTIFVGDQVSLLDRYRIYLLEIITIGLHLLIFDKIILSSIYLAKFCCVFWRIMIHSNHELKCDEFFDKIGLVTSKYHHIHHLNADKNLAHYLKIWDVCGSTQQNIN